MKWFTFKNILMLLIVVIAGVTIWWFRGNETTGMNYTDTYTVKRGPLKITLKEKGSLRAAKSGKIKTELRSGGKITWLVDEGAAVKEGDELVKFETKDIEKQIEQKKNQITEQKSNLNVEETNLEIRHQTSKKLISAAEYKVEDMINQYNKYINGDCVKAERDNKLKVSQSLSKWKRAQEKYKQMKELLEEGFFTPNQVEEKRLEVETTGVEHESAKLDKKLYEKYTAPIELKQKEIAVANAKTDFDTTKKQEAANITGRETAVESKKNHIKRLEDELEKLEKELSKTIIKADRSGLVLYGDPEQNWGEKIQVGTHVWRGRTIMTIPDVSKMLADFHVHEVDINKIKKEMLTFITCETYKGKSFTGKVTKIATVAASGGWWDRGQAKRFKVETSIDKNGMELKPGITASIEVLIEELHDVLYVPVQSVYIEKGKYFCLIKRGSAFERIEVETGQSNDKYVVITDGIKDGDEVALYDINVFVGNVEKDEKDDDDENEETESKTKPSNETQ